jgi:hypothetical protein
LPGGGQQARIDLFDPETKAAFDKARESLYANNKPVSFTDPITGIEFELRPTGWKDANGIHGYTSSGVTLDNNTATLATSGRITHRTAERSRDQKETTPQTVEEVYIP